MNTRKTRLKAIKRIIEEHRVTSQDSLLKLLEQEESMSITQATLSRDLKLLQVGKVSDGNDGYFYTLTTTRNRLESDKSFIMDLRRGFISLKFTHNLAIIRTLPGHADPVAMAIDQLAIEEVEGTIAGDDTIFVAISEKVSRRTFLIKMRDYIPEIGDEE